MAVRKTLGESLGRGENLTPEQMEKFVEVASSAIKGQRPLAEIARATKDDELSPQKENNSSEIFQKTFRKVSENNK